MSVLTAAVVGLGRIGLEFDYGSDSPDFVLTHSRAYAMHPGFRLVAGVDRDAGQRRRFETLYRAPAFESVAAMHAAIQPEVLSVAVATPALTATFREALEGRPKAILCEKPFALDAEEASASLELARHAGCTVMVNYIRRYEPGVRALRALLADGTLGTVEKGQAWYAKGLYNNASHTIDLLRLLLGEVDAVEVLKPGRVLGRDCEPDFLVRIGHAEIWFLAHAYENYSFGSLDLLAGKGRVLYGRGGHEIDLWKVEPSAVFEGYRVLGAAPERIPTAMSRYQAHVLDGLWATVTGGARNASDGENAVANLRVLDEIGRKRMQHGE